jgi:glutamate/tyrosine decarboxylase-like PLP-dependent enzyme
VFSTAITDIIKMMEDNRPTLRSTLTLALDHALDHLSPQDTRSVAATSTLAELRQRIDLPLNEHSMDPGKVLDELVSSVEGGITDSAGGRFFGWVIGGSLPAALAADWLTSAWDQNAGLYACSPAASVVEETAGRWLKEIFCLPPSASFAFVTGAQMAHVTALAAARHALLARNGWDVEQNGLSGSPAIRILTSTEKHGTLVRAVRLLGLGEKHITTLQADSNGRLLEDALEQALEATPSTPTIVVLQAGDVNIGAFDDFARLIPLAKKYGAWVHVDGAFGLWAAATPRFKHLLEGVEKADSWITDGHKWLNVPFDCGYAFVADRAAHRASFAYHAAYLTHETEARDQLDWNPEHSRRARGFATYAAIRQLGTSGIAELIERTCAHAHALVIRIGSLPQAQMLWEPQINQGLVRFLHPGKNATEQDHDAFTDHIMAEILKSGEAFFTGTTWRNRRAMRVSVSNWQTSAADVERVCQCVSRVLQKASASA